MIAKIKYLSTKEGECADDIDLSKINNQNEKKFLLWSKNLEDTITRLQQSVEYFRELSNPIIFQTQILKKSYCFFFNLLSYLCIVITIDLGKLYSRKNSLCLYKYLNFCDNDSSYFKKEVNSMIFENKKILARLENKYEEEFKQPRNKIYGHSDKILLDEIAVDEMVKQVSVKDMELLVELSKKILSSIWYAYNEQAMCFRLEGHDDYKNLLQLISTSNN